MNVIDLSHPLQNNMPVFPGTQPVRVFTETDMATHGFVERRMHISTHTGTHVDAPAHLLDTGKTLSDLSLKHFVGKGRVVDYREIGTPIISRTLLEMSFSRPPALDFLLFLTGWSSKWGKGEYFENYPVFTKDAAAWLVANVRKGVGVDTPSVDRIDDNALPVHHALLANDLVIVENLCGLDQLLNQSFIFTCLPLAIDQGDGSPVRAAALIEHGQP